MTRQPPNAVSKAEKNLSNISTGKTLRILVLLLISGIVGLRQHCLGWEEKVRTHEICVVNSAAYSAALECSGSMFLSSGKMGQTHVAKINLTDYSMM